MSAFGWTVGSFLLVLLCGPSLAPCGESAGESAEAAAVGDRRPADVRRPTWSARGARPPTPPEPSAEAEPERESTPEPSGDPEPIHEPAAIELPAWDDATAALALREESPTSITSRLPRSLGATYDRRFLLDLPGQGLWSLFETIESTAILDRMDGAGMYVGESGLLGVRGSSWTQATWVMDELDITDPDRTGTPLFFVDPDQVHAVEITAGLSPADHRGIGPAIRLIPRRPAATWRKSAELFQAPSFLQQTRATSIARLESSSSARFRIEGPLIPDRLGLFVSAGSTRGARRERDDPRLLRGQDDSLLAHLVYTPTPRDELRFMTGLQRVAHPYAGRARFGGGDVRQSNRFFLLQATWQRQGRRPWSVSAGVVSGSFDPQLPGLANGVVERIVDGPVQLQFPGRSSRGRFAVSGVWDPLGNEHHALRLGASLSFTGSSTRPAGVPGSLTPETVDGLPARVWDYGWRGPESRWRGSEVALYATDRVRYGRLSVDAGVRFDSTGGSAAGSATGIRWSDLSTRLVARLQPFGSPSLTLLSGYAWYHGRLPLSLLAYGDPAGPQGRVYRWRDDDGDGRFQAAEQGELVAWMGPGGLRSSIDPMLQSPRSRDVFVGVESQAGGFQLRFLAYHRRERNLLTSMNVGVPPSAWDVYHVLDPANDIAKDVDDFWLPVYNRRPETFGEDRYLLTNDPVKGHGKGLEILIERNVGDRLRLLVGATASKAIAPAAYRGFQAFENDQGVVGERGELPNAATLSKGRLFFERGYNLKIAGTYEGPYDTRLGVVARYQDGQHFARLVVPTDLNQGPETIRGITNGESRFTFVLTVDARLEKRFGWGRRHLTAVLETFNIGGSSIEVEQYVIWGPFYRATSAVQPPRTVRVGLRLDF